MEHRVGDRRRSSYRYHLSHALGAQGIELRVGLVDEVDLEIPDVPVHRHLILGDVVVEEATEARIDLGFLQQGGPHTPNQTAIDLAGGGTPTHHPSAVHHAQHA